MYILAEFLNEKVTDVIPRKWLVGTSSCYWPRNTKSYIVANLIKKNADPDGKTWKICPINILSSADTFEEARRKLRKACRSDGESVALTSDPEDYGRGKRHKQMANSQSASASSSDDDVEDGPAPIVQDIINNLPPPPSSPLSQTTEMNEGIPGPSGISQMKRKDKENVISHGQKSRKISTLEMILKNQKYMELELRYLKESVNRLSEKQFNNAAVSDSCQPEDFGSFPINEKKDVEILEDKLNNDEKRRHFVTKLRSYGGNNFQDHTRRIMRFLFTNELAEKYNWLENKEKTQFSNLLICRQIVDAVCEENAVTRACVEDIIKNWLRHAKERKNYVKKHV